VNGKAPNVWVLADESPGNRSQAFGVAEALGFPFTVKEIRYGRFGAWPNVLLGASFAGLTEESRRELAAPWPDVTVGAGRRVAPLARKIKRLSGDRTFAVQIMDPGWFGNGEIDLIAVPRHDLPRPGKNILPVTGAPHRVRPDTLAEAAGAWRGRLARLPRPWIAAMVGGSAKGRALSGAPIEDLAGRLEAFARRAGGSLLITSSRRTDASAMDALMARITVPHYAHRWNTSGENPYLGFLALADAVVVTGDSMSMCSEACASGAPVYIFARDEFVTAKYARLHRELYDLGFARPLNDSATAGRVAPVGAPSNDAGFAGGRAGLNAAVAIAAEIRKRRGL
jgi:mitochondrial fission protein ELM1